MQTFGNYLIDGEIFLGTHIFVYKARRRGDAADKQVCLKVWAEPEKGAYSADIGTLFLKTAEQQGELAKKFPKEWVPVLDHGSLPEGHYVVTPHYPDTIARFLGTISADSVLLKFVLMRVITALEQLERQYERDHGNLKPTKILLEGKGPIIKRKLRLNEPAPFELINRSVYRKPDMRSLGELIFLLAGRNTAINPNMRSVPAHASWPRLATEEEAWKNLCSELLDPNGKYQTDGLEALKKELKAFGHVKSSNGKWIVAVAALVFAGMGYGGYYWYSHRLPKIELSITEQYKDYGVAYENWLRELARMLRRRKAEIADDPYLAGTLIGVLEKRGERIIPSEAYKMLLPPDPTVIPEELALDKSLQRRVTEAYVFLLQVQKTLEQWPVRQKALEQANRFRANGWEDVATQLESQAGEIPYDLELFDWFISVRQALDEGNRVLANYDNLQRVHSTVLNASDKLLNQIPEWQLARLREQSGSLDDINKQVSDLTRELRPLLDVIEAPNWKNQYAWDLFQKEIPTGLTELSDFSTIDSWMQLLGEFRRVKDPRTEQVPPITTMIGQIDTNIARLPGFNLAEDHKAFSSELAVIKSELDKVKAIPAIERELSRLNQSILSLQNSISDLNKRVSELISRNLIEPGDWLVKWRNEPITVGGAAANAWTSRRDAVLANESVSSLKAEQGRLYILDRRLNHLRDLLTGIDQAVPAVQLSGSDRSADMDQRLEPFLQQSRQDAVGNILRNLPATDRIEEVGLNEFLGSSSFLQLFDQYKALLGSASEFSRLFLERSRVLAGSEPPSGEFFDFIDREILSPDGWVSRLKLDASAIPALSGMLEINRIHKDSSVTGLLDIVNTGTASHAARWTAWNRLTELNAVPGNPEDWKKWISAYEAFYRILPDTLKPLLNGPVFWERAARGSGNLEMLKSAFAARDTFGGFIESLPDFQRFAFFLLEQRERVVSDRSIFSASGEPVKQWRSSILKHLQESFGSTEDAAISAFRKAIEAIDPDVAAEEIDISVLGPGGIEGWKEVKTDPDGTVTYEWNGFEIAFRPVDVGAGDLYYVATTEMPVGLVIQWFYDNPEEWQKIIKDDSISINADAERKGPHTWMHGQEAAPDYVMQWQTVSPRWELLQYASPLDNSRPNDDHPIQFVSPELALAIAHSLNCELPVPAIYQTLLEASKASGYQWNRRDLTWKQHHEHVEATNARIMTSDPPWPDQNIFIPSGIDVQQAENASHSVDYDDKELWFSDVNAGAPDNPFKHVVGNVAEYAQDSETGKFYVVGSSALSPPEIIPESLYEVPKDTSSSGYSDVGFRLAFSIPRNTPGAHLARVILNPEFVESAFSKN